MAPGVAAVIDIAMVDAREDGSAVRFIMDGLEDLEVELKDELKQTHSIMKKLKEFYPRTVARRKKKK